MSDRRLEYSGMLLQITDGGSAPRTRRLQVLQNGRVVAAPLLRLPRGETVRVRWRPSAKVYPKLQLGDYSLEIKTRAADLKSDMKVVHFPTL